MRFHHYIAQGEDIICFQEEKCTYEIMAVHSKSIYIRDAAGRIFLICSQEYGYIPFAILMESEELESLRKQCGFGDKIIAQGKTYFFPCTGITLVPWEYDAHPYPKTMIDIRFQAFCRASAEQHREKSTAALRQLIGLGEGLTPAGDDLISGYMYARLRHEPSDFTKFLGTQIKLAAIEKTTRISSVYLFSVCDGKEFELLQDLYKAVSSKKPIAYPVYRLLKVGSSSGARMIQGMLGYFEHME